MMLVPFKLLADRAWILLFLSWLVYSLVLPCDNVEAATLGESCSQEDCTGDDQVCSETTQSCVCSPGWLFTSVQGFNSCQLPGYGEACVNQCSNNLVCFDSNGITNTCGCGDNDYYDMDTQQCENKKLHGVVCGNGVNQCVDPSAKCFIYIDSYSRCLCDSRWMYYSYRQSKCDTLANLHVENPRVVSQRMYSITFSWTVDTRETGVEYRIRKDSVFNAQPATSLGGTFYGLQPGTHYPFHIDSYIPADDLYHERLKSYNIFQHFTMPAPPGYLDLSSSQLISAPMTIAFGKPVGEFSNFNFSIYYESGQRLGGGTGGSGRFSMTLSTDTTYRYQVSVFTNNIESSFTQGTFRTSDSGHSLEGPCTSRNHCKNSLSCIDNVCTCVSGKEFWDGKQCQLRGIIGAACSSEAECQDTPCIAGWCSCDLDTQYQDELKCRPKKNYGELCNNMPNECAATQICSSDQGKCSCPKDADFDGSTCLKRKLEGESCTSTDECVESFECVNDVCACASSMYLHYGQCVPRKQHTEACTATVECFDDVHLECRARNGLKRCLCISGYFSQNYRCVSLSDFQVKKVSVPFRSMDSFSLSWSLDKLDPNVLYEIRVSLDNARAQTTDNYSGVVSGLNPGTAYSVNIDAYTETNNYYDRQSATSEKILVWTTPAMPGHVDKSLSQMSTPPMTLVFEASPGNVKQYTFSIGLVGEVPTTKDVTENKITGLTLDPSMTYDYTIFSVNGNGDTSPTLYGTLTTANYTSGSDGEEGDEIMDYVPIIAPVGVGVLFIVVVIVVCVRRHQQKRPKPDTQQMDELEPNDTRPIKIREFQDAVTVMHKYDNVLFQKEFQEIQAIDDKGRKKAVQGGRSQAEHTTICRDVDASFIPGYNQEYIVCKAPSQTAISQFWSMVWNQKCDVIVMFADVTESGKTKSQQQQYWPRSMDAVKYGDFTVEITNISRVNNFLVTELQVSVGDMNRRLIHYFVPAWWDESNQVSASDILHCVRVVRQRKATADSQAPLIVQSSADVGSTGMFITLDYFMQHIETRTQEDQIDVFNFVLQMKKKRRQMVKDETQYILIFDLIAQLIQERKEAGHTYDHAYSSIDEMQSKYGKYLKIDEGDGFDYEKPSNPDDYEEPTNTKIYREPSDPDDYEEPTNTKIYREPSDPDDYEEPTNTKIYREPSDPDDYEEPTNTKIYREPSDTDDYEEPTKVNPYRHVIQNDDHVLPSERTMQFTNYGFAAYTNTD